MRVKFCSLGDNSFFPNTNYVYLQAGDWPGQSEYRKDAMVDYPAV